MRTHSPEPPLASAADRAACRRLIRAGSRTFAAASLLLPSGVCEAAYALYAFCRLSDDLVDIEGGSVDAIARLRERLDRAYAGLPADCSVDRAFAEIVTRFGMPRELPEALIDGLEWDVTGVNCESLNDVYAYAVRVAGSVGAMMAVLMGVRDPAAIARACDLGVAMQLTNIARDVGEDARAGRLYVPLSWLRETGIDPDEWMRDPVFTPRLAEVISRLLVAADTLYERADLGIAGLPRECRRGIRAARFLYAEIGHELRRKGLDSVSRRTVVAPWRKLAVLARSWSAVTRGPAGAPIAALAQAEFLVAAAARPGSRHPPATADFDQKVEWLLGLFERLERRDRQQPNRAT